MSKASYKKLIPQVSKNKTIRDASLTEDPITLELYSDKPLVALKNPHEVIPHDLVPTKIKKLIIDTYGEEFFNENEWEMIKLKKLTRAVSNPRENLTKTIAQICTPLCKNRDLCPYDIMGKAPLGERCILELKTANILIDEYINSIAPKLSMDADELYNDMSAYNLIVKAVELDITNMRLNNEIATGGFTQENPTTVDPETGQVWYTTAESVVVKIKDRVYKQHNALMKQLLATPEMDAKYKKVKSNDLLEKQNQALDLIISSLTSNNDNTVIDAELID